MEKEWKTVQRFLNNQRMEPAKSPSLLFFLNKPFSWNFDSSTYNNLSVRIQHILAKSSDPYFILPSLYWSQYAVPILPQSLPGTCCELHERKSTHSSPLLCRHGGGSGNERAPSQKAPLGGIPDFLVAHSMILYAPFYLHNNFSVQ